MKNLALLISGGATTARAIIDECHKGRLAGKINPSLVIASHDQVSGIENIRQHESWQKQGGDIVVIDRTKFPTRHAFGEEIIRECNRRQIEILGQYGWMELTPLNVVKEFQGRSINQHPGPLDPGFKDFGGPGMHGERVHFVRLCFARAVNRDFWTEATAHLVEEKFDEGAIIDAERVPIYPNDAVKSLQDRVLPVEHEVQIWVLEAIGQNRLPKLERTERLVQPDEEHIIDEALRFAKLAYPYERVPTKK